MWSWVSIHRNPLNYIVFERKHINSSDTRKHFKRPCEQCSSPLKIQFYKSGNMLDFFNVIISNPVIFLPIFNFALITCHNIMASNLESHAIIKCCFDMKQPQVCCLWWQVCNTSSKAYWSIIKTLVSGKKSSSYTPNTS